MDYITCPHTKSQYKISVVICQHCKRMKTCLDYRAYIQPPLFPKASGIVMKATTRPNHPRRSKAETCDMPPKPEQLMLDL